jgi:hypothetical protein
MSEWIETAIPGNSVYQNPLRRPIRTRPDDPSYTNLRHGRSNFE